MRDHEDINFEPARPESDELVRRLRELQWPSVRPEVRERCWDAFNRRLAERLVPVDEAPQSRRSAGTRLDYTRRTTVAKVPPAIASCRSRAWTARPTRRLTARVA
jgi:hypothetical protein